MGPGRTCCTPDSLAVLSWYSELTWSNPTPVLHRGLGLLQGASRKRSLQLGVQPFLLPASLSQGLALLKQQQQERWGRNVLGLGPWPEI